MFLQLNNVCKMYDSSNGVKKLNFTIEKGEFVTLLGPSGCGKTTTLNLIGGFLKPDSGSILLDSSDITFLSPEERPVSTVFQSYALFPHLNVLENVCYGLRFMRRMKKKDAIPVAREYLNIVGLSDYERARVGNLSGGQQQRVALARAMSTRPKILLLDEPLSNLDAGLRIKMRSELKELQKKLGITMIFVTHDQEEALCLSDKIVVMDRGEIAQIGTPEEIYFSPKNRYVASFIGKSNYFIKDGKTMTVRPEEIIIRENENGKYKVCDKTFMGAYTSYLLTDGRNNIEVSVSGKQKGNIFEGVSVDIEFNNTYILSDDCN